MTHTTWRVYCRDADACFFNIPRLERKKAVALAEEHHDSTGHTTEVAKVRYESVVIVQGPNGDAR